MSNDKAVQDGARTKRKPGRRTLIERIVTGLTVRVLWELVRDWLSWN